MRRRQWLIGAATAPLAGPLRAQPAQPGQRVDWPAIALLDGSTLPASAWQGQAAVVVFWATDCAYCLRHNPRIDRLHRATRGRGLRVLGVATDTDADRVRQHLREQGLGFPVALDEGRLRQRLTARRVVPMTCTIDTQGRLLQAIPGEMHEDDVMALARLARPAGNPGA